MLNDSSGLTLLVSLIGSSFLGEVGGRTAEFRVASSVSLFRAGKSRLPRGVNIARLRDAPAKWSQPVRSPWVEIGDCRLVALFAEKSPQVIFGVSQHYRPIRDSCTAAKVISHSITSSARARSPAGMVSPRVFAVFWLMTNSYLVGLSTARSAGLAPCSILST